MERLAAGNIGRRDCVKRQPERGDSVHNLELLRHLPGGQRRDRVEFWKFGDLRPAGESPAGLFCCMTSVWRVRASQMERVAGKNLAGKPKEICVGIAPCVRRQLRFAAGLGEELFGAETVVNGDARKQEPAPISSRN